MPIYILRGHVQCPIKSHLEMSILKFQGSYNLIYRQTLEEFKLQFFHIYIYKHLCDLSPYQNISFHVLVINYKMKKILQ